MHIYIYINLSLHEYVYLFFVKSSNVLVAGCVNCWKFFSRWCETNCYLVRACIGLMWQNHLLYVDYQTFFHIDSYITHLDSYWHFLLFHIICDLYTMLMLIHVYVTKHIHYPLPIFYTYFIVVVVSS